MLNGQRSNFEKNIFLQPGLIQAILDAPLPAWMKTRPKRIFFVGIGTNFHAAKIAEWLWRRFVSPEAWAVHSFDFLRTPQPVLAKDTVVLLSHTGASSLTVEAFGLARRMKALTVAITGENSPWKADFDQRLETCEQEDTNPYTKSLTTTLAWIVRWISDSGLNAEIGQACDALSQGPDFPDVGAQTDLVLLGDAVREPVAQEICLKIQETAYLPARAFGLEQFLHGPRVSVGNSSRVVAFASSKDPRWDAIRKFLNTLEVPFLEVTPEEVSLPEEAGWLWQLFWGQRFTLDICRRFGIDPDSMRTQELRYREARAVIAL